MGLSGAAQSFQRFVDEIFRDVEYVFVNIDDILLFSKSMEEHHMHLSAVFEKLSHYELILNREKCMLGKSKVKFLGRVIWKERVRLMEEKIKQ